MLWVLGFILSFCGLFVWLEFGTMYPRSGGEKVYLEMVYKKPKYLVTVIFATQAILLGFTASGCIVSLSPIYSGKLADSLSGLCKQVSYLVYRVLRPSSCRRSILISAGKEASRWVVRGIALGVIFSVTLLHGLFPKAGIWLMNVGFRKCFSYDVGFIAYRALESSK